MLRIGMFKLGISGGGGVAPGAIQTDVGKIFETSTFHAAIFRTIAKDHVAAADDSRIAVGEMHGIAIARIENVVGENHAIAPVPRAATKSMGAVDDSIVDDL